MLSAILGFVALTALAQSERNLAPPPVITPESGGHGRAFRRWESDQWQVLAGPDYCAADFEAGDMQFAIEWYWWTGTAQLQLLSRNWSSLTARAGRTANLRITVNGTHSWSSRNAIIAGNADYAGFVMVLEGSDAESVPLRLSTATTIDFVAEGRTLGTYEVIGAAEAMQMLGSCVSVMRSTDHSDPFAPTRR